MPNENCLQGLQCPKCQSEEPFRIEVCTLVLMYDDGSDYDKRGGEINYNDTSYCECYECAHHATVTDFRLKEKAPTIPAPLRPEGYVAAGGGVCPHCRGTDTQAEMDWNCATGRELVQHAHCLDCGAAWDEVYTLTGYTGLTIPTPDEGTSEPLH